MESRTQGWRPRTQKKPEAKANDRNARGQGPRTQAQVFSKKKRSSKFFFRRSLKKGLCKFSARSLAFSNEIFMIQKIVLSLAKDREIFEDFSASTPRSRTSKCVLEDSTYDTHSKLDLKSLAAFIDFRWS